MDTRPTSFSLLRPAASERQQSDDEQDRRGGCDVGRAELNDQCRPHIGAEHDGQRGDERDHSFRGKRRGHKAGCRAALQDRGQGEARTERGANRLPMPLDKTRRRSGPKARRMPDLGPCGGPTTGAPHPIRSRRTIVPIGPGWLPSAPQTQANSRRSMRDNKLSFPILSDPGNEENLARFGLRFELPDYPDRPLRRTSSRTTLP